MKIKEAVDFYSNLAIPIQPNVLYLAYAQQIFDGLTSTLKNSATIVANNPKLLARVQQLSKDSKSSSALPRKTVQEGDEKKRSAKGNKVKIEPMIVIYHLLSQIEDKISDWGDAVGEEITELTPLVSSEGAAAEVAEAVEIGAAVAPELLGPIGVLVLCDAILIGVTIWSLSANNLFPKELKVAQDVHNQMMATLQQKIADRETSEAERAELNQQLEAAEEQKQQIFLQLKAKEDAREATRQARINYYLGVIDKIEELPQGGYFSG